MACRVHNIHLLNPFRPRSHNNGIFILRFFVDNNHSFEDRLTKSNSTKIMLNKAFKKIKGKHFFL